MAELAGYLDRWSAAAGERVGVYVHGAPATTAQLDLVRLGSGTQRCEPEGILFEPVPEVSVQRIAVAPQRTDAGSYAEMTGLDFLAMTQGTLALLVQPWAPDAGGQTIVSIAGKQTQVALALFMDDEGCWSLRSSDAEQRTEGRAALRRWVAAVLSWSPTAARLDVVDILRRRRVATAALEGCDIPDVARLLLAGEPMRDGTVGRHFDGRLERVLLWTRAVTVREAFAALCETTGTPKGTAACWELGPRPASAIVTDTGPHGLHGRLVQGPKRAVRGSRWTGSVFDWRQAPDQYAAVHFHRDDLVDADWDATAHLELPASLPSGAYAIRVRADDDGEPGAGVLRLPLFVRPPAVLGPDAPAERVALVFPTFTYLAYANDRCALLGRNPEVLADRAIELEPTDILLSQHPEWGLSLYDTHSDGSGVSVASRWRPIPGLQPDQHNWQAGEGSGRWNYAADLLLVEWLEREGIGWHAFTDEDLHEFGAEILAPYRVVLTGNHPEYATPRSLEAFRRFVASRGRLMYLGGNGFYWKIACDEALPGVIELRRAEDGNRSWAEEPGEYYHAFDGSYGGLWRRNGLAPQSWLGVGYAGQGFRRSVGYRRSETSDDSSVAFVFQGVEGREFGLQGAIGGGCAGVEVDRYDEQLGSDPAARVLASSLPMDDTYLVANEELLVSRPTISGAFAASVRADVVLQPVPGGGAVFSTGSIAWIGGLASSGGDPAVQRITRNVLDRFLEPQPLAPEDPEEPI